jgi:hypothetical protein
MFRYCSIFAAFLLSVAGKQALSQNVGIGTSQPQKLFSVRGSVLIDQNNESDGTLDSAALHFGTATGVGISSNRMPTGVHPNGLNFFTDGINRISITAGGLVGINVINPQHRLHVGGSVSASNVYSDGLLTAGTGTFSGNLSIPSGYMAIGASASNLYLLRVNGNLLVNTNLAVNGNATIGGTMNIGGATSIGGKITNEGKAIMKSNSATTLRSGFTSGTFTISLNAGSRTTLTFCVIPYNGDNTNIRVMVAQFIPGTGASANAADVNINVVGTMTNFNGGCGGYAAAVRFSNNTNSALNLGTDANLYLYSVVTD